MLRLGVDILIYRRNTGSDHFRQLIVCIIPPNQRIITTHWAMNLKTCFTYTNARIAISKARIFFYESKESHALFVVLGLTAL